MSLQEKTAQVLQPNWDSSSDYIYDDEEYDNGYAGDEPLYDSGMDDDAAEQEDEGQDLVLLDFDGDGDADVVFQLPEVPGAPNAAEIVIEDDDFKAAVDDDDDSTVVEENPWDWQSNGPGKFLKWLKGMLDGTPQHSGYDASGLERAIAYLEILLKEITKAMRVDFKGEIDVAKCEDARDQIEHGIERMIERLDRVKSSKHKRYQKKKASWAEDTGLVKEAQKIPGIGGITVIVPLFISRLARVLINGTVSAGHSMEDMYDNLVSEWDLTKREEAELQQLLADMGFPIPQDRGLQPGEKADRRSSDNFDWSGNFNS